MSDTATDDIRTDDENAEHGTGFGDVEGNEEEATAPNTMLTRIKARRAAMAEEAASGERSKEFPIPGYNNEVWLRAVYHPDTWDKLKKIGVRATKSKHPRRELHAAQQTLAMATTEILVTEDGGQTFEPFDPAGESVGFDDRLADLMEFPAKNASEVVSKVFNNDLAVTAVSNRVSEWMQGEDEEIDEDFGAR